MAAAAPPQLPVMAAAAPPQLPVMAAAAPPQLPVIAAAAVPGNAAPPAAGAAAPPAAGAAALPAAGAPAPPAAEAAAPPAAEAAAPPAAAAAAVAAPAEPAPSQPSASELPPAPGKTKTSLENNKDAVEQLRNGSVVWVAAPSSPEEKELAEKAGEEPPVVTEGEKKALEKFGQAMRYVEHDAFEHGKRMGLAESGSAMAELDKKKASSATFPFRTFECLTVMVFLSGALWRAL